MRILFSALLVSLPLSVFGAPVNQAPAFANIAPQSVNENQNIVVPVSATDPEGNTITLTAQGLPANASFVDQGGGNGAINFTPNFTQAGQFTITVTATDDGDPVGVATVDVSITVNNVNRAPIMTVPSRLNVDIGDPQSITFGANDLDGDLVSFNAENLFGATTLTDNGDSTATLFIDPSEEDIGENTITITADDGNGGILAVSIEIIVGGLPPVEERCSTSGVSRAPWGALLLLSLFGLCLRRVRN